MARASNKHDRDQALDFHVFLNELQDWELSLKQNEKKPKAQVSAKTAGDRKSNRDAAAVDSSRGNSEKIDYSRNFNAIDHLKSTTLTEDHNPNAVSEKELGNEYFKQRNFKEAIACYSRSIALSPTAVSYANRAMSYLKCKRFQEAEDDCTEALNLDDRYIKAYSRRATARKELGKLKKSIEDAEFALRLDPSNQEIKKQYVEVSSLYEKEVRKKESGSPTKSVQRVQKVGELETNTNVAHSDIGGTQPTEGVVEKHSELSTGNRNAKQELNTSVQELARRAAIRVMTEASRNMMPPKSAYEFEVSWQGFCGDPLLQVHFLKVTPPSALPKIFKSALSATLLVDIIKCIAIISTEDMDLAVKYLKNLTHVPRFSMLIMCLSSAQKADVNKLWDQVLSTKAARMEYADVLDGICSKYCVNHL